MGILIGIGALVIITLLLGSFVFILWKTIQKEKKENQTLLSKSELEETQWDIIYNIQNHIDERLEELKKWIEKADERIEILKKLKNDEKKTPILEEIEKRDLKNLSYEEQETEVRRLYRSGYNKHEISHLTNLYPGIVETLINIIDIERAQEA